MLMLENKVCTSAVKNNLDDVSVRKILKVCINLLNASRKFKICIIFNLINIKHNTELFIICLIQIIIFILITIDR